MRHPFALKTESGHPWGRQPDEVFCADLRGAFLSACVDDSNHWYYLYGLRLDGRTHGVGLSALSLMLRTDWMLTDIFGLFVTAHQFDIVSPEAKTDLFIAYVDYKLVF